MPQIGSMPQGHRTVSNGKTSLLPRMCLSQPPIFKIIQWNLNPEMIHHIYPKLLLLLCVTAGKGMTIQGSRYQVLPPGSSPCWWGIHPHVLINCVGNSGSLVPLLNPGILHQSITRKSYTQRVLSCGINLRENCRVNFHPKIS